MKSPVICCFSLVLLFICIQCYAGNNRFYYHSNTSNGLSISGQFSQAAKPDSVYLDVWSDVISGDQRLHIPHRSFRVPVSKKGAFNFKVAEIKKGSYISLGWAKRLDKSIMDEISLYAAQPGDDINLNIDSAFLNGQQKNHTILYFSGKGAAKYNCRYQIDSISNKLYNSYKREEFKNETAIDTWRKDTAQIQYVLRGALKYLSGYKSLLSPDSYQVLSTYVLLKAFDDIDFRSRFAVQLIKGPNKQKYTTDFGKDSLALAQYLIKSDAVIASVSPAALYNSPLFSEFALQRLALKKHFYSLQDDVDQLIQKDYQGHIKEKLIVAYILNTGDYLASEKLADIENRVLVSFRDSTYWNIVQAYINKTGIGKPVTNFSLPDKDGKLVTLADFKNKVVFVDFWFVGCGNCERYYQSVVSKIEDEFQNNPNVKFLTISVDPNKTTWIKGLESGQYTSDKAINLIAPNGTNSDVAKQFNVTGCPHPILIDKQGKIFSNSDVELREKGIQGLRAAINRALSED